MNKKFIRKKKIPRTQQHKKKKCFGKAYKYEFIVRPVPQKCFLNQLELERDIISK